MVFEPIYLNIANSELNARVNNIMLVCIKKKTLYSLVVGTHAAEILYGEGRNIQMCTGEGSQEVFFFVLK